ncbi:20644_t:CDS:2, partial [Gigaspora rosea]
PRGQTLESNLPKMGNISTVQKIQLNQESSKLHWPTTISLGPLEEEIESKVLSMPTT